MLRITIKRTETQNGFKTEILKPFQAFFNQGLNSLIFTDPLVCGK